MENDIAVTGFFILAGKGDGWITHDFISSDNIFLVLVSADSASYSWSFVPTNFGQSHIKSGVELNAII